MRIPPILFAGIAALSAAAMANPAEAPAAAVDACKLRAVEGSQFKVEQAELTATAYEGDRFQLDIASPAGNIRCVVSAEGEVYSADEVDAES